MNIRGAARRPAAKCPWITGIRLQPIDVAATLVDISWTGARVSCGVPLKPGSNVTVVLQGTLAPKCVHGRVARYEVGGIGEDHQILYIIGIVFDDPLILPHEDQAPVIGLDTVAVAADPVLEVENRW